MLAQEMCRACTVAKHVPTNSHGQALSEEFLSQFHKRCSTCRTFRKIRAGSEAVVGSVACLEPRSFCSKRPSCLCSVLRGQSLTKGVRTCSARRAAEALVDDFYYLETGWQKQRNITKDIDWTTKNILSPQGVSQSPSLMAPCISSMPTVVLLQSG